MEKFIAFKGGHIRCLDEGKGRALVLLHGFLESADMWAAFVDTLQKSFRVISIDLPGHGQSDCFGYVHPMELMGDAVKAVLDDLNIRKCVVVGHSMGGYAALAFAENHPDHVKGLCLFHSTAQADTPQKKKDRDQAINLVKANHKSFIRMALPLLFRPKNRALFRPEINTLKAQALKTSKRGIVACLRGMKDRLNREVILRFAPYPVFFIIGAKDTVIPMEKVIPQAKLAEKTGHIILQDAGHMGFIEAQEESLKALKQFARKCY